MIGVRFVLSPIRILKYSALKGRVSAGGWMTGVRNVPGATGPIEEGGKKQKASPDSEKFKEAMKVQKVREIDPEEQKKRKRREESEEEEKAETVQAAPLPTPPPTPPPSPPLAITKGGAKPLGAIESSEQPSPYQAAPSETSPHEVGAEEQLPPSSSTSPQKEPEVSAPPVEKAAPKIGEQPQAQPTKTKPPSSLQQPFPKTPSIEKETLLPLPFEKPSLLREEEVEKFFKEFAGVEAKNIPPPVTKTIKDLEKEKEEQVEMAGTFIATSIEGGQVITKKEEKEKTPEKIGLEGTITQPTLQLPTETQGATLAPPPAYAFLHPQVFELFSRMVGVIEYVAQKGMNEWTFTLNEPQYASSVFYGTQIIIQEFSTAPKMYNIQLNGSSQAMALAQANANDLLAAFQGGNYAWRVNRLEMGLVSDERFLFRRKEPSTGSDMGGGKQS